MDAQRRKAIERTSGALTGAFPPGFLKKLRGEWDRPWDESLVGERDRRPCVAGTRIYVEQVLGTLADSHGSIKDAAEYLDLSDGQVEASVRYARQHDLPEGTARAG